MSSIESIHPVLRAKWEQIFRHDDADKDGVLTKNDFLIVQDKLLNNPNMTPAKRQEAMVVMTELWEESIGADFGSTLTMESFLRNFQRNHEAGILEEVTTKLFTRIFYCIDLDGDERISPREYQSYATAMGQIDMPGIERSFHAIDSNGDGEITLDEYVSAFVRYVMDTTVTLEEMPLFGLPM